MGLLRLMSPYSISPLCLSATSGCSSENNESVITASMLWPFLLEEGQSCSGDVIRLWLVSELFFDAKCNYLKVSCPGSLQD